MPVRSLRIIGPRIQPLVAALLGEVPFPVDLLRYPAASPIEDLQLGAADRKPSPDTFSLQLRFVDGSIGTVHYFASGSKAFPKERLEVFACRKGASAR